MRQKLLIGLGVLFLLTAGPAKAFSLPVPGITPDSIYYPLDILGEQIVLFFTFDLEVKINKTLMYAEEKMAEAQKMMENGNEDLAKEAVDNYQNYLQSVTDQMENLKEDKKGRVAGTISEKSLEYQALIVSLPENPERKRMLDVSQKTFSETITFVSSEEKKKLEEEQERIKNQTVSSLDAKEEEEEGPKDTEQKPTPSSLSFTSEEEAGLEVCQATENSDVLSIAQCYEQLGKNFESQRLCDQAGDVIALGSCYGGIASATGSPQLCAPFASIPSEGASTLLLSTCYGSFSHLENKVEKCDGAPTNKAKTGCYLMVAGLKRDVTVCEYISEEREGCFILVAAAKGDSDICGNIEDFAMRSVCMLGVASGVPGKEELCQIGESLNLFNKQDCLEHLKMK